VTACGDLTAFAGAYDPAVRSLDLGNITVIAFQLPEDTVVGTERKAATKAVAGS